MTRMRIPKPGEPIVRRGPMSDPTPRVPEVDDTASDVQEPVQRRPPPRIDFATGRVLPDLPEPVQRRPPPRIDFATGRVLPDLPEPVQRRPQPRIDFATGRVLPDLPVPASARTTEAPASAAPVPEPQTPSTTLPYREEMEQTFGTSFAGVSAHLGEQEALSPFGARAAAWSETVAFASSTPGRDVVAHELAHIEQLRRAGGNPPNAASKPGDSSELEAARIAAAVDAGAATVRVSAPPTGSVSFDRSHEPASKLTPDDLAELIVLHPHLREDVLALAERIGGATYVQRVLAALEKRGAPKPPLKAAVPVTQAPLSSTASTDPPRERIDATITDTTRVESVEILHAEEIFADVPKNTDSKKHVFGRLNSAVRAEKLAEAAVANAKTPKAVAHAQAKLTVAQAEVTAATEVIKKFIADKRIKADKEIRDLTKELATATKKQDAAKITELKQAIANRQDEIRNEVASMKHIEVDHTDDSVFAPVATDVTHHDFAFADDEHVRVRDHVVSYATTVPFGVDSEGPIDHAQVRNVMSTAGLSESRRKILQAISWFEGGFDTVNTYDRAQVTWGFVQWTGGKRSDLTVALTIIKQQHPEAFATAFQAYGIDVLKNELVITPPDGSPAIRGDQAADAIMRNPRLAAVLAHAGRNEEIQKGQVQAASQIEIEAALSLPVELGRGKAKVTSTAGALLTSEYGVGLLVNTFVHSGIGAADKALHKAIVRYLAAHPYVASDEAWRAGAEAAIISALAFIDDDRATSLSRRLNTAPGSFQ